MVRPVNYLFCRYVIEAEDENLGAAAEFNLIAENQGGEFAHGREKDGTQPQTLCTDPVQFELERQRGHSFEIGFKPGVRIHQIYDEDKKKKVRRMERDDHTKFGHVVTFPELGAMAVRDRTSDDTIGALQTLNAMKSLVRGISDGEGQMEVRHASEEDLLHALETWKVEEYSFTARPLNPTGTDLAKMRTEMLKSENVFQERGVMKAPPGEGLTRANGTLGQTYDLYKDGYAQIGFKGHTEDGHSASIPKPVFSQDKRKNLEARDSKPRYLKLSFSREAYEDDVTDKVAAALLRFYSR